MMGKYESSWRFTGVPVTLTGVDMNKKNMKDGMIDY